jgi:hypothetical protein
MAKKKSRSVTERNEEIVKLFGFNARRLANMLSGREVLDSLEGTYGVASSILAELQECKRLTIYDTDHLSKIAEEGYYQPNAEFWHDLNQLLIAGCLGEASSMKKIIEGMAWALDSRNEIIFALCLRSYIEHASVLNDSVASIFLPLDRIAREVWPNYPNIQPNQEDMEVRDNLVRFIMGRIAQLDKKTHRPNDSRSGWEKFHKSLRKVPEKFRVERKIMHCIDALCEQEGCRLMRAIYELLSEYCHPNSASRSFGFQSSQLGATLGYDVPQETDISSGLYRLFAMSKWAIPPLSLIVQTWFVTMSQQKLPMPPIMEEDKTFGPGKMRARDQFGREFYNNLNKIHERDKKVSPLNETQLKRLKRISTGFSEVDDSPLSDWVSSFEKDFDPEKELHIWEHLLDVYESETAKRPNLNLKTKKLIFNAIIHAVNGMSASQLLSLNPVYKSVPDLKSILQKAKMIPRQKQSKTQNEENQ